jgi:hypothetical protein
MVMTGGWFITFYNIALPTLNHMKLAEVLGLSGAVDPGGS